MKSILLKFILVLAVVIAELSCAFESSAQSNNSTAQFLSPNAAGLGVFGKYDISPFTGLAPIDVDVFNVNEGDINIHCRLSYFSGGVKPSQHPGWVGQNWSLLTGGIVTRTVNAAPDEVAVSGYADPHKFAYLFNYSQLANNWTDASPGGEMEQFSKSDKGPIASPDQFDFALPSGVSGSFFLNHLGQWVVKTKAQADLKIEVAINPPQTPFILRNPICTTNYIQIKQLIYTIIITDEKGMKYTFGATDAATENAIEFTRQATRPPGTNFNPNNEDVVANAWHLTSISSPKGNVVNYVYQRYSYQFHQHTIYPSAVTDDMFPTGNHYDGTFSTTSFLTVETPSYLQKITANSFTVNFGVAETNELQYSYIDPSGSTTGLINNLRFGDMCWEGVPPETDNILPQSKWFKLTSIDISDVNGVKEKYAFDYNDNSNERLFLKFFRKISLAGDLPDQVYTFDYDPTPLPSYNRLEIDEWGYYNKIPFPSGLGAASNAEEATVRTYLMMNPTFARAGILTSIGYPTGASTTFQYEANKFSKRVEISGSQIQINTLSQEDIGGGMRVSDITNADGEGNTYTTHYSYTNSGGVSTGISAGKKRILNSYVIGSPPRAQHTSIRMDNFTCLNYTDGRDVVYSEVKKVFPDNSSTVYKYSNSDQTTYLDEYPAAIRTYAGSANLGEFTSSNTNPRLGYSTKELERGQLKSEETFDATGKPVKGIFYTYNADPSRLGEFVRAYDNYFVTVTNGTYTYTEWYIQAVRKYTYYPFLSTRREVNYDQSNPTSYNETTTVFTYATPDHRQTRSISMEDSDGNLHVTENTYNKDICCNSVNNLLPNPGLSQIEYDNMSDMYVNRNMISLIHSNKKLNSSITNQDRFGFNSAFLLETHKAAIGSNPLEVKLRFNKYDDKGNLLELQEKDNGITRTFLWGYGKKYPVAEVVGADWTTVSGFVNQTVLNDQYTINEVPRMTELQNIRNGLAGSTALVTTYTYYPLIGMASKTDANGLTTYYSYDSFGRLKGVTDPQGKIISKYTYHSGEKK